LVGALLLNFAHLVEARSRVKELALFCAPKALEATWIYLEKRNLAFQSKFLDYFVFVGSLALIAVGSQGRQGMVSKSYKNLFNGLWSDKEDELPV
jgi:hypothetical protein